MEQVLCKIGKVLNENHILWAIGGSVMLHHKGLVNKPNDIDILIAKEDIVIADQLLSKLGHKKIFEANDEYETEYFYEYQVDGIDVDVMCQMVINHDEGMYRYIFDRESIVDEYIIDDVKIPLCSMEDWYIIYQLIKGREEKVQMIESYFTSHGVLHKNLIERSLNGHVTQAVINRTKTLL